MSKADRDSGGPGIDLFEAVFRKSADCIKLLDIEGRILLLNAGGVATMELDDPQALIGRNWIDFWSGTERDAACAAIQTACGGGVGRFRGSLPTAKGTPKNWDTVITPLRSGSGPVARLVAVSRDVTEQETLRTELDAARRRNQAIVLATSEIVWQADASQQTGSGTGLAAFSGVAENAGTRADWLALIHPEERDGIDALSRDAVLQGTGYVSEYRLRHHSGGYRWVEDRVVPLRDRHGDLVEWVGVISDIDARVTAHRALREGEERLRLAIRASHVGIWDIDLVTGTRRWSEEAKAILGLPADATESRELFLGLIDPEDRPRVQETFDADCTLSRGLTFRFRRHDTGVQRWLTVSGKTVLDGTGRPVRRIGTFQDVTERKITDQKLWAAANQDPLTALPNRNLFGTSLEAAIRTAERAGTRVGLILVDLDHFKDVNDTLGHDAGDVVLRTIARRLTAACPHPVVVARLGGDEFALLLPDAGTPDDLATLARRLVRDLAAPTAYGDQRIDCPASIGLALFPDQDDKSANLLKNADLALYAAKRSGRARFALFDRALRTETQKRTAVLRRTRAALLADEIVPFYQPKVAASGVAIIGVEALLRWRRASGVRGPAELMDAFADPDLAAEIGRTMLGRVIDDIVSWRHAGLSPGPVAINVAVAEFARVDVADRWLAALDKAGLPASALQAEITESVFLGDGSEEVGKALQALRRAGTSIALDDFGTGYASLTYLRACPVDWLKIDRGFIRDLDRDEGARAIVSAVITLAHDLAIRVVAEGVETAQQLAWLRRKRCDVAQGYLVARPMAASRLPHFLRSWVGSPDAVALTQPCPQTRRRA